MTLWLYFPQPSSLNPSWPIRTQVVEGHRSFTTAAIELGVTTFALTYSVRNLEARRGGLLYRNNRTASPTDTGTTLAERLALGFQEIRCALAEVESAS